MIRLLSQSAPVSEQQFWTFIGLAGAGVVYLVLIRPMMRRKSDPLTRAPQFGSLAQQRSTERQMQNLLVQLAEMSRQVSAQLDTRAARLDALIREADEKIARLHETRNKIASAEPRLQPDPAHSADSQSYASSSNENAPSVPDPRHADVYALADEGHDARSIAEQLARPSGEIELILALRET